MTSPISIELRSIKSHPALSRGTTAYNAKIMVDGVVLGEVSNDGNGGCDRFHPLAKGLDFREAHRLYDDACRRVKTEMPKQNLADPGEPENLIDDDMDFLCARLVGRSELLKRMRRMMKTKVLMFEKGRPAKAGTPLYEYRLASPIALAGVATAIRKKHPDAWILNEQPEDQALAAMEMAA